MSSTAYLQRLKKQDRVPSFFSRNAELKFLFAFLYRIPFVPCFPSPCETRRLGFAPLMGLCVATRFGIFVMQFYAMRVHLIGQMAHRLLSNCFGWWRWLWP
jgi:hypothetical protein